MPHAKGRVYDRGSWRRQGEKREVANFVLEVMHETPTFHARSDNRRDACGDGNPLSKPFVLALREVRPHARYNHAFQLELGHARWA